MSNNERILEFEVDGQRITKKRDCDFSNIVSGTIGYLKAKFYFSQSDWESCTKVVSFWLEDQENAVLLDDNNMCTIPKEALTGEQFKVSVIGQKSGYRITTNKTKVKQEVR